MNEIHNEHPIGENQLDVSNQKKASLNQSFDHDSQPNASQKKDPLDMLLDKNTEDVEENKPEQNYYEKELIEESSTNNRNQLQDPFDENPTFNRDSQSKNEELTINQKVDCLLDFLKQINQATLTTINWSDQNLRSNPMYVYERIHYLNFYLLTDANSQLVKDIKHNPKVNLAFNQVDKNSTNWCSVSGIASIITESKIIENLWNPTVRTWLRDLGDEMGDGSKQDPRLVSIYVESTAINYFIDNQSTFSWIKDSIALQTQPKYSREKCIHLFQDDIDAFNRVHVS